MPHKFYKVNIEISNICNLQCTFCPEVVRPKNLMSPDLFRTVIEQVAPLTRQVTFHLMGEPLVHPQLADLVDIGHAQGVRIFFVTNGVLLREKEAEILLHPAFQQVSFSLHSFFDNFPGKDPAPYLERIFRFTERALRDRPGLFLNYRLWNLSDPKGQGTDNREMLRRIAERFQVSLPDEIDTRVQKRVRVTEWLSLHFDVEFTWPEMHLPVIGESGTCYGLSSHFGVLTDGTVVPCCLDKEGVIALGNISEKPLSDILGSPRAQTILKGFQQNQLTEELCKRCQYIERFL